MRLLVLSLLVVIAALATAQGAFGACTDTDGGILSIKLYTKGTVTTTDTRTDYCNPPAPSELREYYCDSNGVRQVDVKECPLGLGCNVAGGVCNCPAPYCLRQYPTSDACFAEGTVDNNQFCLGQGWYSCDNDGALCWVHYIGGAGFSDYDCYKDAGGGYYFGSYDSPPAEICDGRDNDCDTVVDDGLDPDVCAGVCTGNSDDWISNWRSGSFGTQNCCGDDASENFIDARKEETSGDSTPDNVNSLYARCCDAPTDCSTTALCADEGMTTDVSLLCKNQIMYRCGNNGNSCRQLVVGATTYHCSYSATGGWRWRTAALAEECSDAYDNDCDGVNNGADECAAACTAPAHWFLPWPSGSTGTPNCCGNVVSESYAEARKEENTGDATPDLVDYSKARCCDAPTDCATSSTCENQGITSTVSLLCKEQVMYRCNAASKKRVIAVGGSNYYCIQRTTGTYEWTTNPLAIADSSRDACELLMTIAPPNGDQTINDCADFLDGPSDPCPAYSDIHKDRGSAWLSNTCCGNTANEWYLKSFAAEVGNQLDGVPFTSGVSACCNDGNDCVDSAGVCYPTAQFATVTTPQGTGPFVCSSNNWYSCTADLHCAAHLFDWSFTYDCYYNQSSSKYYWGDFNNPPADDPLCGDLVEIDGSATSYDPTGNYPSFVIGFDAAPNNDWKVCTDGCNIVTGQCTGQELPNSYWNGLDQPRDVPAGVASTGFFDRWMQQDTSWGGPGTMDRTYYACFFGRQSSATATIDLTCAYSPFCDAPPSCSIPATKNPAGGNGNITPAGQTCRFDSASSCTASAACPVGYSLDSGSQLCCPSGTSFLGVSPTDVTCTGKNCPESPACGPPPASTLSCDQAFHPGTCGMEKECVYTNTASCASSWVCPRDYVDVGGNLCCPADTILRQWGGGAYTCYTPPANCCATASDCLASSVSGTTCNYNVKCQAGECQYSSSASNWLCEQSVCTAGGWDNSQCCIPSYKNNCDTTDGCGITRATAPYNSCDLSANVACGAETNCSDGIDNNCNGQTDEGKTVYYRDVDGDAYGNCLNNMTACPISPAGYVLVCGDCDDSNPAVHPGGIEVPCNAYDEDCSGGALPPLSCGLDLVVNVSGTLYPPTAASYVTIPAGCSADVKVSCSIGGGGTIAVSMREPPLSCPPSGSDYSCGAVGTGSFTVNCTSTSLITGVTSEEQQFGVSIEPDNCPAQCSGTVLPAGVYEPGLQSTCCGDDPNENDLKRGSYDASWQTLTTYDDADSCCDDTNDCPVETGSGVTTCFSSGQATGSDLCLENSWYPCGPQKSCMAPAGIDLVCTFTEGSWEWRPFSALTEDCGDGVDNDCDGLADEADTVCGIRLELAPNPSDPSETITASFIAQDGSLDPSTTKRVCDYKGCAADGSCKNVADTDGDGQKDGEICSGTTTCAFTAPNAGGIYGYALCYGANTNYSALNVGITCATSADCPNGYPQTCIVSKENLSQQGPSYACLPGTGGKLGCFPSGTTVSEKWICGTDVLFCAGTICTEGPAGSPNDLSFQCYENNSGIATWHLATEALPQETYCKGGRDNDCDGLIDCADGTCLGRECETGKSCTSTLPPVCDVCIPATDAEPCNALDDDCDGVIDEGCSVDVHGYAFNGLDPADSTTTVTITLVGPVTKTNTTLMSTEARENRFWLAGTPAGRYTLRATAPGLGAVQSVVVTAGLSDVLVMLNGQVCTDSCTDGFVCDYTCLSRNGCALHPSLADPDLLASLPADWDSTRLNETVKSICQGKTPGTRIPVFGTEYEVFCCGSITQPPPIVTGKNAQELVVEGCAENLVKFTRIVNYDGRPVRMIVLTWEKCKK